MFGAGDQKTFEIKNKWGDPRKKIQKLTSGSGQFIWHSSVIPKVF